MVDKMKVVNLISKKEKEEIPLYNMRIYYLDGTEDEFTIEYFGTASDDAQFLILGTPGTADEEVPPVLIRISQIKKVVTKRIEE